MLAITADIRQTYEIVMPLFLPPDGVLLGRKASCQFPLAGPGGLYEVPWLGLRV
jgi:hypothetical protein